MIGPAARQQLGIRDAQGQGKVMNGQASLQGPLPALLPALCTTGHGWEGTLEWSPVSLFINEHGGNGKLVALAWEGD